MGNCCSSICCCCNCCCKKNNSYELIVDENEQIAIKSLLKYLENRSQVNFFQGEPLRALKTLAHSDHIDLQRSAALAFAEVTEKDMRQVSREALQPILFLLKSPDVEVQRAASAALGNLAVNIENKLLIVKMSGLDQLIKQMSSKNVEVQCNAVGCITNLATHDENKSRIAKSDALRLLINLASSKDPRVQRNATGALLNMTHSQENRQHLVNAGAIPVLIRLLSSDDADVQYYCTTALSNIAVDASNRKELASSDTQIVQHLIALMDTKSLKVQCQAALALRNLASDAKYQVEIVQKNGLKPLLRLLKSAFMPLILSSVACVRNISIHPTNESPIIEQGFVHPLIELLSYQESEEIQCHAISTLRNLAASSETNKQTIVQAGAVERIKQLISSAPISVMTEMTAAIAVLALSDALKPKLLNMNILDALVPVTFLGQPEVQGNAAAAIGNLSSKITDYSAFVNVWAKTSSSSKGIKDFLILFLKDTSDIAFQHIGVWTIEQFLDGNNKELCQKISDCKEIRASIERIANTKQMDTTSEIEDSERDIYSLARKVLITLDQFKVVENKSFSGETQR